jgi:hypothetical protein
VAPSSFNGRVERNAGVAAASAVLAGQDAADAAGPQLAPIPGDLAAIDTDMAQHVLRLILNQHPQVGMGKGDAGPWQILDDIGRPDRVVQRLRQRPRCISVQDLDLDAHGAHTCAARLYAQPGGQVTIPASGGPTPGAGPPGGRQQVRHARGCIFRKLRCLRPMEPSIRVPVKPIS